MFARSDDVEKWMNILILVVLAAFWAIANLVRKKKLQHDDEQDQSGGRPVHKASTPIDALRKAFMQQRTRPLVPARYRLQARQRPSATARPRPATKEPGAKEQQPGPTLAATPLEKPKQPSPAERLAADLERRPEIPDKPIEGPQVAYLSAAIQKVEYEPALDFLFDYEDPDELRRAILHYEILGKPLSLRRSGEHIMGL